MTIPTPQYLLEFSMLLGVFWLFLPKLRVSLPDRQSLLAGIPIICMLLPGLRFLGSEEVIIDISLLEGRIRLLDTDWGFFWRNAGLSDLIFIAYWLGFAVFLARIIDRWHQIRRIRRAQTSKPNGSYALRKSYAGLVFFAPPADMPLLQEVHRTSQVSFRRSDLLEVWMIEIAVLIFWWNPLIHRYRKLFHQDLRNTLVGYAYPGRRTQTDPTELRHFLSLVVMICIVSVLAFNVQQQYPIGAAYSGFFEEVEEIAKKDFVGDLAAEEEETVFNWGGHQIPLAEVRAGDSLSYSIYYLQPFEFHLLRQESYQVESNGKQLALRRMFGRIGIPNSGELSVILTEEDFRYRLPRLVSMGDQTLYLRMEDGTGRNWVAVLAVSESNQVYNLRKGLEQIAGEVASFEPGISEEEAPTSPYRFEWGGLVVPLEKYASPDVYRGFIEIPLDSFLAYFDEDMKFYAQDSILMIEELSVRAFGSPNLRAVIWYPEVLGGHSSQFDEQLQEELISTLAPGHEITIYGEAGDLYINTIAIRIHDPNQLYRPDFRAPRFNEEAPEYTFQLVNRPGYPSIIRVDTLDSANERIMEIYRNREEYQVLHVPGFRTNERLVNFPQMIIDFIENQTWFSMDDMAQTLQYPEVYEYIDQIVQLNWGTMWASPNSSVYSPQEYELNRREAFRLLINGEEWVVEKAMSTFVRNGKVQGIYFLEPGDWKRPHLLPKVTEETSVFVEDILVRDSAGHIRRLPLSFAFHIGQEISGSEWEVRIEEDYAKEPELLESDDSYSFRHYRLSELVAELLSIKTNRMAFENQVKDPLIQVYFRGEGFSRQQAYEILIRHLQKKYGFLLTGHRVEADVRRMQVNYDERLLEFQSKGEQDLSDADRYQIFDPEGYHVLTGITLHELADLLEERFDVVFEWFPTPYTNRRFNFSLVLDNLPSVQQQLLETYGIQMFEGDWLFNGVLMQFVN